MSQKKSSPVKVVEFNPDKRQMQKAWESFKESVNKCDPLNFKSALFYLDPNQASVSAHLSVFGPDWQMTGRVKIFMQEIEMENYMYDFAGDEEDEEEE